MSDNLIQWMLRALIMGVTGWWGIGARAEVIADLNSVYHHIQVVEEGGYRVLSFDGSTESRISLSDPMRGHFEYTEYFHMPWLWNTNIGRVLMIGLGGATTQRRFAHDYPDLPVDTVEIDPMVVTVAKQYFFFQETGRHKVYNLDGRVFLRRSQATYDLIIMDAYSHGRYGSYLPHHLATKEFFELAKRRLSANGVICYNVMGTVQGRSSEVVGALGKTLNEVFPQVYMFPVLESYNVVLLATMTKARLSFNDLHQRASSLVHQGRIKLPGFRDRVYQWRGQMPFSAQGAPVLTDDYAPLEGMMKMELQDRP